MDEKESPTRMGLLMSNSLTASMATQGHGRNICDGLMVNGMGIKR